MNNEVLNLELGSRIIVLQIEKNVEYHLRIAKEKFKEEYRIFNSTRSHICPCKFDSLKAVEEELLEQQSKGKIAIVLVY